jgi:hypothetical protein
MIICFRRCNTSSPNRVDIEIYSRRLVEVSLYHTMIKKLPEIK